MHTQVAIVGAGPAGLMLGHLLHLRGIDSVILENRSRDYVIERVRAGVLEQGTVDLHAAIGRRRAAAPRRHAARRHLHRLRRRAAIASTWPALTGGRAITIYGQNEVVRDLIDARLAQRRGRCSSRSSDVSVHASVRSATRRRVLSRTTASSASCRAISSPAATASMASAGRRFRRHSCDLRARLSVRLARHPRPRRAVVRRARLQPSRARLRALQHALAAGDAALPAVRARRGSSTTGPTIGSGRSCRHGCTTDDGWRPNEGPILQKGVTGHAQLRRRADALRPAVPRRRRRAHRAAHRRQGPEPGDGRRLTGSPTRWRRSIERQRSSARRLFGSRPAPHLARAAVLVVDDVDAAPRRRTRARSTTSGRLAELDYLVSSRAAMTSLAENYVGTPFED